ncbi:MAG: hypothetical protein P4L87_09870 [Formivibrio sp.]|nr:hypothetical protein [Formivibrio sp.]
MGQNFLPDTVNQILLFPASFHDWLPEGYLARFLVDVVSALDLSAVYTTYSAKDGRGQAAYAPEMTVRLFLCGYAIGVCSSRKIQTGRDEKPRGRVAPEPDSGGVHGLRPSG